MGLAIHLKSTNNRYVLQLSERTFVAFRSKNERVEERIGRDQTQLDRLLGQHHGGEHLERLDLEQRGRGR